MLNELLKNDLRLRRLTSGQFRVLIMLIHLIEQSETDVTISLTDLQVAVGLHASPLRRYLHALARIGMIERIEQFDDNGAQLANRYRFCRETVS